MIIDCVTFYVPCGLLAWIAHLKSVISLRNEFRKEMCYMQSSCRPRPALWPTFESNREDVMVDCY